jgi:hypothetical protein
MTIRDVRAACLDAQALRLRKLGLSYKEVARRMDGISQERARLRALAGLRAEATRQGKRYYHLKHDTYLNWRRASARLRWAHDAEVPCFQGRYGEFPLVLENHAIGTISFAGTVGPAVPELSTWAMMLLGFAGLGFVFHRSRRKLATA